ncbi:MAG: hypothetical protein GF381_01305 [Candidatus Pacebacteria bacterium]|nr:hypothetical protein [Candidatus Paceibacterota bacterium]
MRVIKFLLKSLIILIFLGLVSFLVIRELFLLISISQLKSSLKIVRDVALNQTKSSECMSRGSLKDEQGQVHDTQLRFVDERNYVIEAVCNQFELSPIQVDQGSLPFLARKEKGVSGVVWGVGQPGINLIVLNRIGQVYIEEGQIFSNNSYKNQTNFHQGPSSECVSFGFKCCQMSSQAGQGELKENVLDCPKSCYEGCQNRPLVLNLSSQPYYDRMTRQLEISNNQLVTFSYTISPSQDDYFATPTIDESADWIEKIAFEISRFFSPQVKQAEQIKVLVDFGDGETQDLTGLRGQVQHVYTCLKPSCQFEAQVIAENHLGIKSLQDLDSSIEVIVVN